MHMTDVLAIVAHPDDADIFCGGTIAKHSDEGDTVQIVHMTRGEYGGFDDDTTEQVANVREKEAHASGSVLGADDVSFLDFHDGHVEYSFENRLTLVSVIRSADPSVILTHHADDMHPDHRATSRLVRDAYYMASLPLVDVPEPACSVENVFFFGKPTADFDPETVVDITGYQDQKEKAIRQHESQVAFLQEHGGIDAEFDGLIEGVRSDARSLGKQHGVSYAEGFIPLHRRARDFLY
jgi:bacillithiol biosynthesis deacetylase BshB1